MFRPEDGAQVYLQLWGGAVFPFDEFDECEISSPMNIECFEGFRVDIFIDDFLTFSANNPGDYRFALLEHQLEPAVVTTVYSPLEAPWAGRHA